LIAGLTKIRAMRGSPEAASISAVWPGVQTFGSTSSRSGGDHVGRHHLFALAAGENAPGHRRQPDIGIEPDPMGGMSRDHRTAARLRNVPHQQTWPAIDGRDPAREALQELDQRGWPDCGCATGASPATSRH
jgi:hypothetical protein